MAIPCCVTDLADQMCRSSDIPATAHVEEDRREEQIVLEALNKG